jgi:hypothetical protein
MLQILDAFGRLLCFDSAGDSGHAAGCSDLIEAGCSGAIEAGLCHTAAA